MWASSTDGSGYYDILNTQYNGYYCVFMLLWSTLLVESWKRKQIKIASYWHVRNIPDSTAENKNFVSVSEVNSETKTIWRINPKNPYLHALFIGIPVVWLYIGLVFFIQYLLSFWKQYNKDTWESPDDVPFYMAYGPFVTNAYIIIWVGKYFGQTSRWLVTRENHRQKQAFENSLINKQYLFAFINANISNWNLAFIAQNFNALQKNLIIIMGIK